MVEIVKLYIFLLYLGIAGKGLGIGFQGGKLFLILIASLLSSYVSFIKPIPLSPYIFLDFTIFFLIWSFKKGIRIKKEDIIGELIFLLFFIFTLSVRIYSPDIFGAEKPMEFAFITSLSRTLHLPPYDPWLLGYLNPYYYFGFIPITLISRLLSIPNEVMFNLFSCFIFSISAGIVFEVLYRVKKNLIIGISGTVITLLIANYERLWAILHHKKLIDYWASSRVIPNTINEFPLFSFIHGDNHPHYLFLPISILGIYILYKEKKPLILLLAVFTFIINPWAIPFFLFLWCGKRYMEHGFDLEEMADIFLLYIGAFFLSLPFLYTRGHTPLGIGIVRKGSNPIDLFIHFGPFFLLTLTMITKKDLNIISEYMKKYWYIGIIVFLFIFVRPSLFLLIFVSFLFVLTKKEENKKRKFFLTLLWYAYLVVTGCEILFIKDIYRGGAFYRGNTVFKFYFLSWVLFGVSLSYLNLINKRKFVILFMVFIIIPALIYLPVGIKGRINTHLSPTLNGIRFIKLYHPIDYELITYINKNIKGHPGIAEAVGERGAYTYYGRISTYTGLPTIMGWRMHELVWRGYIPEGDERMKAVETLYTGKMEEKEKIIKKYKVRYMIIGELEKREYGERLIFPSNTEKIKVQPIKIGKGLIVKFEY